jgi:site-specific recombinase XerD
MMRAVWHESKGEVPPRSKPAIAFPALLRYAVIMDILYLFHCDNEFRLPFYAYDRQLWLRIFHSKTARWDAPSRVFCFTAGEKPSWEHLFCNIPFVILDENSGLLRTVGNFFEKPMNFAFETCKSAKEPDFFSAEYAEKLKTALYSRKYSLKTIKLYVAFNRNLCNYAQKEPLNINFYDVQTFIAHLDKERGFAASSMNLGISAIKFFYRETLHTNIIQDLGRPKGDKKLPPVLSKSEVLQLFDVLYNEKHRFLLELAYSAGLRVGELVKLKVSDLDFERKTVFVRAGKGRKDRYTLLSRKISQTLFDFCRNLRGDGWLFSGNPPSKHLSERSAQHIFEQALQKAGINKPASIHSLRHSFATHLLENGTDISYIKELLGHSSLRTTERYAHVAKRKILSIQSPLDTI